MLLTKGKKSPNFYFSKLKFGFFQRLSHQLIFAIILIVLFGGYWRIKDEGLFIDEYPHYQSIKEITQLQITEETFLRNAHFPGYYLLLGFLGFLFKNNSIALMRFLNTLFSVACVYVFHKTAKEIDSKSCYIKTFQFLLFPILFPFFFLIYNDVLSLFLVLLSFLFLIKKRINFSVVAILASILIRQNNIIWVGFLITYLTLEEVGKHKKIDEIKFASIIKDIWLLVFIILLFGAFFLINRGATFGANRLSQPVSFHLDNIYFSLFLLSVLFFPLILDRNNFQKMLMVVTQPPYFWLIMIFFPFYLKTFRGDHPWNSSEFDFFLRNNFLKYFLSNLRTKALLFAFVAFAILLLATIRLKKKNFYLLYPFSFIFLSFSWLVEPRYYFIPYTFFILFREESSVTIEFSLLIFYALFSRIIFFGTLFRCFFL